MKEAGTKDIDMLTQEDFDGAFQKLLERYNNYIAAGEDYFEGYYSFMCVLSIKVPIRKKSGNLFNDPRNHIIKIVIWDNSIRNSCLKSYNKNSYLKKYINRNRHLKQYKLLGSHLWFE